jgi:hypothetical protein
MRPVLAAAPSQSKQPFDCHPETAESLASERLPTKDLCTSCRRRRKSRRSVSTHASPGRRSLMWTDTDLTDEDKKDRVPHFSRSVREVG